MTRQDCRRATKLIMRQKDKINETDTRSMTEKMLFVVPPEKHGEKELKEIFAAHPEVKFVSLSGVDSFGHDTDEKIPVPEILDDVEKFLSRGVQTDGSSVLLPGIASIANAKVDILPDRNVNWYVDHNFYNKDEATGLPTGTLRIPSFLVHNDTEFVGSRSVLDRAQKVFKEELVKLIGEYPYVLKYLPFDKADDIKEVVLTTATEMEFYVKTPHESADRERLHTSQEMKEQYWKRTVGPVRTALENSLAMLNAYGLNVEMGHKEVGGVKAELGTSGYDHIMEQLEIDWRYADPMQTADNDRHARYVIKDTFRRFGLDVSFLAKPVEGVAGSGKHTHFGVAALLKDGKRVNLFAASDPETDYMNPLGFGALMGLLRNYDIMNPFANATNDAFNRLRPGFEAPICIVTSLGHSVGVPSRNRTVLVGLIRDTKNPLATHFELRSPNPRSNSYLVMASGFIAMLDGMRAVLAAGKDPAELTASISKGYGAEDFYLETDRIYRAENNIFEDYTPEDRDKYFGKSPATVWENINAFERFPEKTGILFKDDIMSPRELMSFRSSVLDQWVNELKDRIVPGYRDDARKLKPLHGLEGNALDEARWKRIERLRAEMFKDDADSYCVATRLRRALNSGDYETASALQLLLRDGMEKLSELYAEYEKNII